MLVLPRSLARLALALVAPNAARGGGCIESGRRKKEGSMKHQITGQGVSSLKENQWQWRQTSKRERASMSFPLAAATAPPHGSASMVKRCSCIPPDSFLYHLLFQRHTCYFKYSPDGMLLRCQLAACCLRS